MEDVEVALFLARVGDSLQDVRIPTPWKAIPFPEKTAFTIDGKTDWRGFAEAVSVPLQVRDGSPLAPSVLLCVGEEDWKTA